MFYMDDRKKASVLGEGLAINLISNGICFVVGCIVAYLKHEGSEWVSPLLFGALAWLLTMGIWVIARLFKNIPVRQVRVTHRNIHSILRNWLDDIGLKVQTLRDEESDFGFIVTTDGGRVISIRRLKQSPERLTFRALYKDDAQTQAFAHFTDDEKAEARLTIQLELSRAVMGYLTPDILQDFTLVKTIPISPSLTIEDVSRTLWEVEAALNSVFYTGAALLLKKRRNQVPQTPVVPPTLPN